MGNHHPSVAPALRLCVRLCVRILLFSLLTFAMPGFCEQKKEDVELQRVLSGMDSVAKDFRTFRAKFFQRKYTAVLKEFDKPDESGEFCYSRTKDGTVLMRQEVLSPGKRITTVKGDTGTIYRPDIKEAQIVKRDKMQNYVEYFALGIGQYSSKLREKFKISYAGSEIINKAPCSILIMVPKDPKVELDSITVWLKESSWTPAQYKFLEPSKDYILITFSDEKVNSQIPSSKFEQNLPSDVERQKL
jgi:outer membrane lipoprotein-sorting protein